MMDRNEPRQGGAFAIRAELRVPSPLLALAPFAMTILEV